MGKPKKNLPGGELPMIPEPGTVPAKAAASPAQNLTPAAGDAPAMVDFKNEFNKAWRVEKFADLAAEFHLRPMGQPPTWSETAAQFYLFAREHSRQWLVVRRVFGVGPVIPDRNTPVEELRIWTRQELVAQGYEVAVELDSLRALLLNHWRQIETAKQPEKVSTALETVPKDELPLDDKILEQFQFSDRLFRIMVWDPVAKVDLPRPAAENKAEREWFIQRVKQWSKMLANPMAGPIARDAVMNDLYLRRLEGEIATSLPRDRDRLLEQKDTLSVNYRKQVDKLQEIFPEMAVAGQVTFHAQLCDVFGAYYDYQAMGDRRRIDRVFTAAEIEFAMESSMQVGMRYRFSLQLCINECIHHFYTPEFRSMFKPHVLKMIDAGFRAAAEVVRESSGRRVVDLENGVLPGDGDEFEDFNDAQCPECGGWISSGDKKCRHCGMAGPNDKAPAAD